MKSKGCKLAIAEMASISTDEQPDVFAVSSRGSVIIEVKMSKRDFKADARKPWRMEAYASLGRFRFFVAPKGVLDGEEIPHGWGLYEFANGRFHHARGPKIPPGQKPSDCHAFELVNSRSELEFLTCSLRKLAENPGSINLYFRPVRNPFRKNPSSQA